MSSSGARRAQDDHQQPARVPADLAIRGERGREELASACRRRGAVGRAGAARPGRATVSPVLADRLQHLARRPSSALIAEIEAGAKRFLDGEGDLELPRDTLDQAIRRAAVALDANPLLILDQFEEYFLYHTVRRGRRPIREWACGLPRTAPTCRPTSSFRFARTRTPESATCSRPEYPTYTPTPCTSTTSTSAPPARRSSSRSST